MQRFIGTLLIIGVISVIGFVFRDRLSSAASELQVGDCFDVPAEETIEDVQHQPCTDPHTGEVILVADFTGAELYPTDAELEAWVRRECVDRAFPAFVGDSFDAREDIDLGFFYPREEGWSRGDREMVCYVSPVGGGPVSASYRAAP